MVDVRETILVRDAVTNAKRLNERRKEEEREAGTSVVEMATPPLEKKWRETVGLVRTQNVQIGGHGATEVSKFSGNADGVAE